MDKKREQQNKAWWQRLKTFSPLPPLRPQQPKVTDKIEKVPPSPYRLIQDPRDADGQFYELQRHTYSYLQKIRGEQNIGGTLMPSPSSFHWESGKIYPGRAYFFLKRANTYGWLIERTGMGWVLSRANKVMEQDLFLRQEEPWDIATLYVNANANQSKRPPHFRVASSLLDGTIVSMRVYHQMILDLVFSSGQVRTSGS